MSTTITNLPETSKVNGSDYLVLDQPDKTVKSTVSNFLTDTGVVLATQLKDTDGADLIQSSNGNTVQEELNNNLLNDREQWRRSLAEAGLTLVDGSFEEGATLNNNTDAVWYIAGAQCYTWGSGFPKDVPPKSTPTSTGGIGPSTWVSVSSKSLRQDIASNSGFALIGHCPGVSALRGIEPVSNGQKILLSGHTEGYNYGGGEFTAVLDGSTYTDDNGNYIKTTGGAVWIREKKTHAYAADYGFITNDASKATSNAAAIVAAAKFAFENGTDVWLPFGKKYIDDVVLNHPVTICANMTVFGSSLVSREQESDILHIGSGYAFDFTPQVRPTTPSSENPVIDGPALIGLSIRGTNNGKAGWRVNNSTVVGNESYARRNVTIKNCQVSGYHSGYGYEMYWTFTNKLHDVIVWDCAVTYYIRSCYATDHFGCIYENSSYGCLAINCYSNNHYGGAVEGIRSMSAHTKPAGYDENGNSPLSYDGIGFRVRGGNTTFYGGYVEANRIHAQIENAGRFAFSGTYINNTNTERMGHGISGELRVTHCNIQGDPSIGTWVQASASLHCSYAEIHSNAYVSGTTKPNTVPNIASVGEFDVYDGTISDSNGARRVRLGQDFQTGGYQTNGGVPRETYSEIFATRVVNAGNGSADRTVDISALATVTGQITALQSAGTLTFTNTNTAIAKEGRDLCFVINASGACSLVFGSGFRMVSSSPISLKNAQTAVIEFRSQGNKYYQKGPVNIMVT